MDKPRQRWELGRGRPERCSQIPSGDAVYTASRVVAAGIDGNTAARSASNLAIEERPLVLLEENVAEEYDGETP